MALGKKEEIGQGRFRTLNPRIYVWVWVALIILTGVTVSAAGRDLGYLNILIVLGIASLKSGLVLNYFMHLRYEKDLLLFKLMVPGILILMALFVGLTFVDVASR
jgi:cytochrome c oxidase subunit IV